MADRKSPGPGVVSFAQEYSPALITRSRADRDSPSFTESPAHRSHSAVQAGATHGNAYFAEAFSAGTGTALALSLTVSAARTLMAKAEQAGHHVTAAEAVHFVLGQLHRSRHSRQET
jgi:hypothetical protein